MAQRNDNTSEMLQLTTLYNAQLEESLKAKLMKQQPELFDPPSD